MNALCALGVGACAAAMVSSCSYEGDGSDGGRICPLSAQIPAQHPIGTIDFEPLKTMLPIYRTLTLANDDWVYLTNVKFDATNGTVALIGKLYPGHGGAPTACQLTKVLTSTQVHDVQTQVSSLQLCKSTVTADSCASSLYRHWGQKNYIAGSFSKIDLKSPYENPGKTVTAACDSNAQTGISKPLMDLFTDPDLEDCENQTR